MTAMTNMMKHIGMQFSEPYSRICTIQIEYIININECRVYVQQ